jgi:transglutaminase-like putative cysteine protease
MPPAATVAGAAASLLASAALAPLFAGLWWWLVPVVIATLVAVGCSVLGRELRWPLVGTLGLGLVGLLLTLTVVAARSRALAGCIPTPGTVRALSDLVSQGRGDINTLTVPVPHRDGLVVLTIIGIYVVALAVDMIAVTLRRPTLAGLPLLGLFAVPAAVLPHGVGVVPFVLGAIGYLLLLLVAGRETAGREPGGPGAGGPGSGARGKPEGGPSQPRYRTARPALVAAPIALLALGAAVAISTAAPAPSGIRLASRGGSSGGGSTSVTQPIVTVAQRLHATRTIDLIRVQSTTSSYLRTTALEDFDGERFTLRALRATSKEKVSNGLPKPVGTVAAQSVAETIRVSSVLTDPYLPLPGTPVRITGLRGDWRVAQETGTIFSTRANAGGQSFSVTAVTPSPNGTELAGASPDVPEDLQLDTALPPTLDTRIPTLARTLTASAGTAYAKALAVQDYFQSGQFTYDLNGAPTSQSGALSEFLFNSHRGYCEQFASAMTVMMRSLGIPTRLAIGYTGGARQPDGTYLITNRDAHAWPEVWFANTGWVRFEPTVSGAGGNATLPSYAPPVQPGAGADPGAAASATPPPATLTPEPLPGDGQPSAGPGGPSSATAAPEVPAATGSTGSGVLLIALAVALGLLAVLGVLAVPGLVRRQRRRRRLKPGLVEPGAAGGRAVSGPTGDGSPAAAAAAGRAAWEELCDLATDYGQRADPTESPRALAERLAALVARANAAGVGSPGAPGSPDAPGGPGDAGDAGGGSAASHEAGRALKRLAGAYEIARYGPAGRSAPISHAQLAQDITAIADALRAAAGFAGRARAAVVPSSVFEAFGRFRGPSRDGNAPDDALSGTGNGAR